MIFLKFICFYKIRKCSRSTVFIAIKKYTAREKATLNQSSF